MVVIVDTTEQLAQRQTSLRIGEIARALSSHSPDWGKPDSRHPTDIAVAVPHRTWQLNGFDQATKDTFVSVHDTIKAAFNDLIKSRTQVTHGTDSTHMPILSEEQIGKLQKVIQEQTERLTKLNIHPNAAAAHNLDSTMGALRVLSDELKIASQLHTNPQAVVDVDARAQGYGRIYDIGQQQGKATMERDAAIVAQGGKPPKGTDRHVPLPDHVEAERRHYAHPLGHNGAEATNVVTPYRPHADGATAAAPAPATPANGAHPTKPIATPDQPHAPHAPHRPNTPHAPGTAAGVAMAATVGVAALVTGSTPAQAARIAGESALTAIPGVGGRLAPNRDEAAVRDWVDAASATGTAAGMIAGGIAGSPIPGAGNVAGAAIVGLIANMVTGMAAEEYYRIKARYFEGKKSTVDPSAGEQLIMAAMATGKIGIEQLQVAINESARARTDKELTAQLGAMNDKGWGKALGDKDGTLTLAELKAAFPKGFDFKSIDKDGNGISGKEITDALAALKKTGVQLASPSASQQPTSVQVASGPSVNPQMRH